MAYRMTRLSLSAGVLLVALAGCAGATPSSGWVADGPHQAPQPVNYSAGFGVTTAPNLPAAHQYPQFVTEGGG
jgi:hypothetical protein